MLYGYLYGNFHFDANENTTCSLLTMGLDRDHPFEISNETTLDKYINT